MPADILIYAIVAAALIFWLRNVLGTRHGDEHDRPNPFAGGLEKTKAAPDNSDVNTGTRLAAADESTDLNATLERNMTVADAAQTGLLEIMRADRSFDVLHFLRGAQDAFAMIVEGFAKGDRETLQGLLAPSVYGAFEGVITARENKGEKAFTEIHAIRKIEIIEATLDKKTALLTIRFVADETNVLHDKEGRVVSGNSDRISETIDIWTFARDIKSRDPRWLLTATRDEDAADHDHKTVPDC